MNVILDSIKILLIFAMYLLSLIHFVLLEVEIKLYNSLKITFIQPIYFSQAETKKKFNQFSQ